MAISIANILGTIVAEIGAAHKALRVQQRPDEAVAWNSFAAQTGLVTGIAAGAQLFTLRYSGTKNLLVRRLQWAFLTTTLGAAGRYDFASMRTAYQAPNVDSGGASISIGGKHRSALATPNVEARVATTTGLTAATGRVNESGAMASAGYWSAAIGSALAATAFISQDSGDHPVVLAPNEGLYIAALAVPAATAVGMGYVGCEVVEADWP